MVKAKIINSKSNEGVEETKTDPITNKIVHSADEFAPAEKKSRVKRDGTIDKRSLKSDIKKDLVMAEMALEIKRLKNNKTDKELKADIKQAKKQEKEDTKQAKILERETKRQEKLNKKQALQQIVQDSDGKSVKITNKGKIDMRGRSTKCREHQQNIIGTMREALRKSYVEKAKKHIDEEDPEQDFEIVPVPKIELIVQQIERERKEIDYKALYEASLTKTYASAIEQEMASAKRSGAKKRLQQQILKDI